MRPPELVRLGDVATIVRKAIAPERISDGTTYVGLENIERGGALLNITSVSRGDLASTKFEFTADQVLFGKLRPYLAKIARPAFSGVCSTDILPITPGPRLDKNYLAHYLVAPDVVALASARATGANLPRLSPSELANFEIPLPSLVEQRKIAAILDQADALRAKRREAFAHLDDLTQSIFLHMFGDPVTNPLSWPNTTLTQLGQLDRGVSRHRPRNDPSLLSGVHPLVQTGEVANSGGYVRSFTSTYSDLGLAQSKMWPAGTLCITIAANIAKTGILTFDACFPDSVVGFTSDRATTQYVRVWLGFLQATLERAAPQSAQKNINLAILRSLPVPKPPAKSIQQFARRVERLEDAKALVTTHTDGLDRLFLSLQSRAFAGEL